MDFKLVGSLEQLRTIPATVGTATVIEAGDLVALSSGVIVKAGAASAEIAYCPNGSADGETTCYITKGSDFELSGTSDANFAVTDKGLIVDIAGTTTLLIDLGESTTDVLKVSAATNAGTAGSTSDVRVSINKPIQL